MDIIVEKKFFSAPYAKVLIVDDINTNLYIARNSLYPYSIIADLCNSGIAAIEMLKSSHYDLVFMDYKMPEMDGIETTRLIREWEKELEESAVSIPEGETQSLSSASRIPRERIPIIALTTYDDIGAKEMFLENGFNDYLLKPIDNVKLIKILKNWIPKEKQKSAIECSTCAEL